MEPLEVLLPILIRVQTRLGDDLSLATVAAMAGMSPFHFHRLFKAGVGETLKKYTQRLRLEQAAFRLALHDDTILNIALGCGFQNHETFTRAFRRRFGVVPSAYRERVSGWRAEAPAAAPAGSGDYGLSGPSIVEMRETHIAFIRHVGPYECVSDALWDELDRFAMRRKLEPPRIWFGIGHDSPGTTAAENLRFDAGVRVPAAFAPSGRIAHQSLPARTCAMFTYVGSFATLPAAYAALFPKLFTMAGYRVIGLPAIEVYRTARINAVAEINCTEIYLPVEKVRA